MPMTRWTVIFISTAIFISTITHSQTTDSSQTGYKKLDTLIFFNIANLHTKGTGKNMIYIAGGKKIDKESYDKYFATADNIKKCTPCYLEMLDALGRIELEGVFYTDICVGIWIEYFQNGKIKYTGHYKENNTNDWGNFLKNSKWIKYGQWTMYDINGKVTQTELYKNGKLIRTDKY